MSKLVITSLIRLCRSEGGVHREPHHAQRHEAHSPHAGASGAGARCVGRLQGAEGGVAGATRMGSPAPAMPRLTQSAFLKVDRKRFFFLFVAF